MGRQALPRGAVPSCVVFAGWVDRVVA